MFRFSVASGLVLLVVVSVSADVFNMPPGLTSLEVVTVGNPGNAADTRYANPPYTPSGYGSVGYTYNIGKYEVTAGQYTEFLNAVAKTDTYWLYHTSMSYGFHGEGCRIQRSGTSGSYTYSVASDSANRPVNLVSWGDAARFANWMHNGQPTGPQDLSTTEDGSYYLNGATSDAALQTVTRKPNATWVIPSEDEWYKAAYYKGGSTNAGYWDYPTRSNTAPGRDLNDVSGNNANYYTGSGPYPIDPPYYTTVAGQFGNSASPYDTFDQGGNVWEWNETIVYQHATYSYFGMRGGSFLNGPQSYDFTLRASYRDGDYPSFGSDVIGFRIAEVPEPGSHVLLATGGLVLLPRRHGHRSELK
jgi:formylglycine-generating enzyme